VGPSQRAPVPTIRDISTPLARRYLYHLSERGLRPRSRLRFLAPVRACLKALVQHGALGGNPLADIAMPERDPPQRLLVTDDELQQVLEAAGRNRIARRGGPTG
jgi:site-specific recombinase XerC